ncbi:hypothetical protein REPUB_Repub11eG0035600 [Reevesia pubescens]
MFTGLFHLNLSTSNFTGKVPSQISHLSELVSLDLSWNDHQALDKNTFDRLVRNLTKVRALFLVELNLSSIYLHSLMNLSSSLTSLNLKGCDLQGKFPISIFHLPNLKLLDLKRNKNLIVNLPKFNWSSPLEYLNLFQTSSSGELPNTIGNLKALKHLQLGGCNFSRTIPRSLGNLSELIYLELSSNHFNGPIPSSLINLTKIQFLYIFDNQLEGSIPSQLSAFPNLIDLDLSNNLLNGTLPPWFYTIPSLKFITIHNNQLTGHIHEFQYKSLTWISFGNNKLQGQIPMSMFELVNLTDLDLSSNNLSGILESNALLKLRNLNWLDLSYNNLSLNSNINSTLTLPNLQLFYLPSFNISEFPTFLRDSKNLEALDLSNNRISGQIPEWMWEIGRYSLSYLNLSNNFLTGLEQIPWQNIQTLDLSFNLIQGNLPVLPVNTIFLSISNNSITGEVSSLLCNLSFLMVLDMSHNELSGNIPQCVGNFSNWLSVLNLGRNRFHGKFPPMFGENCGLKNINLNGNQLEGSLPRSLINCREMEVLDLANNKLNDTFPSWLETLPVLQVLILRSNNFHGFISNPKKNHSFCKLRILDLSDNDFRGTLPAGYIKTFKALKNRSENLGSIRYMEEAKRYECFVSLIMKSLQVEIKISTIFTSIDLSLNKFDGEIPEVFGELISLKGLNLSHNNLGGHIPPSMGNLINLEWLDLSSNKISGEIPKELENLTFLSILNLSCNQLEGPIPSGKQFNTFENESYEGNKGLCGFPMSKACDNKEQRSSSVTIQGDSKLTNDFDWKVVLMGYGCGMAFGLAMGYVVFKMGKPKWFVKLVLKAKWSKKRAPKRKQNKRILDK